MLIPHFQYWENFIKLKSNQTFQTSRFTTNYHCKSSNESIGKGCQSGDDFPKE